MKTLICVALLLVGIASVAYGLKCYECTADDSAVNEDACGDTFDKDGDTQKTYLNECSQDSRYCRKQKTGVNHVYTRIERSCATDCEERNIAYTDRVVCCGTDGCNGGGDVKPVLMLLLSALAITGFIKIVA